MGLIHSFLPKLMFKKPGLADAGGSEYKLSLGQV
jgi:hypothetical protein